MGENDYTPATEETSRNSRPIRSKLSRLLLAPLIAATTLTGCSSQGTGLLQGLFVGAASSATNQAAENLVGGIRVNGENQGNTQPSGNVVYRNNQYFPASGYTWVNPDTKGDFRVKRKVEVQAQTRTPNPHSNDDYIILRQGGRLVSMYGRTVEYTGSVVRFFDGKKIVDVPIEDVSMVSDICEKGRVDPSFEGLR